MDLDRNNQGNKLFQIENSVLFFDLAGTLVETDGRLSKRQELILKRIARRAYKIVLVTGQAMDDPQVQHIINLFVPDNSYNFVAYTTRGGSRFEKKQGLYKTDLIYLSKTRISNLLYKDILREISYVIDKYNLKPLIPIQLVDEVAVRVNLVPEIRKKFILFLTNRLNDEGLRGLQVVPEGRTSIFVMLEGIGKRYAVEHELNSLKKEGFSGLAIYFGNEFNNGNDEEVLVIPNLKVIALGICSTTPHATNCRRIGKSPDDLYDYISRSLDSTNVSDRPISVLCLSLGGTKFEIGALTNERKFLTPSILKWRDKPEFAGLLDNSNIHSFCDTIVQWINDFLKESGFSLRDVKIFGIPFPGPKDKGLWYSNNLINAFRSGADLEKKLSESFSRKFSDYSKPKVRVIFDAQCDAGGELYHPKGRLFPFFTRKIPTSATVLNIATGIAAGFIKNNKVLIEDKDFYFNVNPKYDGGAGQLGRHLWYHPNSGKWTYNFSPGGRIPKISPPAIRMTECLSGPALATRLLLILGTENLLNHGIFDSTSYIDFDDINDLYNLIKDFDPEQELTPATQIVRHYSRPLAGTLLRWIDDVYDSGIQSKFNTIISNFVSLVAKELSNALYVWMNSPGWGELSHHIILTGGVGIKFMQSLDKTLEGGFCKIVEHNLPSGCKVERSQLKEASERESFIFLYS